MEEGICENTVIHEDTVKNVKEKMPEDGLIYDIAELFKVFADSTRMKIIYALMEEELCVCDIVFNRNGTCINSYRNCNNVLFRYYFISI